MLRKVFKTILVFTICFGITIPANAGNVSVSDGAAFITKSELSYELNNLSNRMTQLENSLDSRIDSLVSSYLTRNGVWNGDNQQLLSNTFKYGFGSDNTRFGSKYFNIYNGDFSQSSGTLFKIKVIGADGRNSLINKCSKSGMIFFNIKNGSFVNQDMRALPISNTNCVVNCANVRWIYSCYLSYQVLNVSSSTWETKAISSSELIGFGIGCSLQVPALPIQTVSFFVNKDDEVSIYVEQTILDFPTTGNDASTLGMWAGNQQSYKTYVIDSANIY